MFPGLGFEGFRAFVATSGRWRPPVRHRPDRRRLLRRPGCLKNFDFGAEVPAWLTRGRNERGGDRPVLRGLTPAAPSPESCSVSRFEQRHGGAVCTHYQSCIGHQQWRLHRRTAKRSRAYMPGNRTPVGLLTCTSVSSVLAVASRELDVRVTLLGKSDWVVPGPSPQPSAPPCTRQIHLRHGKEPLA